MARRIAIFGQAAFGRDVMLRLLEAGHEIVGVHVPPDRGRPDPLAAEAEARAIPLLRFPSFRRQGAPLRERVEAALALGAELHVMPYTTVILPPEIVDAPPLGSLCFHPSLLPRFRGGAAIPWQIILGARKSGVTVFRPDAGVDTGPIVVQKGPVPISDSDTAASLYFEKLYPLGIDALLEAVALVDAGRAEARPQDEREASFQGLVDDAVARVDWSRPAAEIDRLIRGCDPQPGAHARAGGREIRLYDSRLVPAAADAAPGTVLGFEDGRMLVAAREGRVAIGKLKIGDGKKGPVEAAGLRSGERLA